MRIAVYGGSFNPPHVGHAMVAAWLLWTERVERVYLLPSYAHPFGKSLLDWDIRLSLCHALAETVGPGVEVCGIESELPTPSYSIDTLKALRARTPGHRFHLVVGADVLPDTAKWKAWDEIETDFKPIIVGRGGYPPVEGAPTFPELSSTEIRQRLGDGRDVGALVPSKVLDALGDRSSHFSSR